MQIHFKGEKKPEKFRVDDMAEATIAALDGHTRLYFQYRLISNDKQGRMARIAASGFSIQSRSAPPTRSIPACGSL